MNLGIDQPGANCSDANALAGDLVSKSDREGIDGALGCCVVDVGVGCPESRRDRRQIDDDTALAAVARRHPLYRFARAKNAAGDVDRHHALDAFGGHLVDARRRSDDAGVVDERAERSEFVGCLEQREDIAFACDIALHRDRLAVLRLDGGDHVTCRGFIAGIADANPKTAAGGGNRGGAADAAAAAGDHYDLVGQDSPPLFKCTLAKETGRHGGVNHKSSTSRAGSSRLSLTRTRNVTASLPSMTRWS